MKKVLMSTRTQMVDHETGEIIQEENVNVVRIPREPPYVKMYLDDLSKIIGLRSAAKSVLHELVSKIDYDGIVTITKGTRERIGAKTGMKEPSVRNRITELVKSGVLKKVGYCEYEMNPHLFAKGDWKDIQKRRCNFKLEISYIDGEREINGSILD